jgi:hypothetical protein
MNNTHQDSEDQAQSLPVSFTICKSTGVLSKKCDLDAEGNIVKTPAAQMTSGTAQRIMMDFSEFGKVLTDADAKTAFGYGLYADAFGDQVKITVKGKESDHAISRSKQYFEYRDSPGIIMNDHDPHPRGPSVTPDELQSIITQIFPPFNNAAAWIRGSLSAGVHRQGEQPQPGTGFHLYTPVLDASDIPRFGAVLFKRLWLDGYGYIPISAAGTFLTRSILDAAVYSPERLDFVGRPIVRDGLCWTQPKPVYRDGGHLDTRLLPDLSADEEKKFTELVAEAKRQAEPERAATREAWLEKQVKRMMDRGVPEGRAREALERLAKDGAKFDLYSDFVLDFVNHGAVTVGELMRNPKQFDGKAIADPFEGEEYGTTTAKFYANAGRPCINSNAHGGMIYYLHDVPEPREEPPRPLKREIQAPEAYPVDVMGDVLKGAALSLQKAIQAPLAICAQSVLAGACLAVQGLADVVVDGRTKPLSCYFLTIGESGERKTAVDTEALREHRDYQDESDTAYRRALQAFTNNHLAYTKAKEEAVKKAKGYQNKKDALEALGEPPEAPVMPRLMAAEPTYEGLYKLLQGGRPSMGLFSDEAGTFIGGHGLNDDNKLKMAAGLSSLWDGKPLDRVRGGDGASGLKGRRVCAHLMAQPGVAAKLFSDGLLIEQGLISRFLACHPESTRGTRHYNGLNLSTDPAMQAYHAQIHSLLRMPMHTVDDDPKILTPPVISATADAKSLWIEFYNLIEEQLSNESDLGCISGFGNKVPEHALRLAGVLSVFDDPATKVIDWPHMAAGIELAQFYVTEALRLFYSGICDPKLDKAEKLLKWAQQYQYIHLSQVYQFGPNSVRDAATAKEIAGILQNHGWLIPIRDNMELDGAHRKTAWKVVRCSEN